MTETDIRIGTRGSALRGLEEVARLGRIEPLSPSGPRELVMEWRAEAQETLDRLAERQTEGQRHSPVVGGRSGRCIEVMRRCLGLRRIQVLEKTRREDVPALAEKEPLLVCQGEDPG